MQLKNISIRNRLFLIAAVAVVALSLMLLLMQYQARTLGNLATADNLVAELNTDMLMLRRHEKDFLLRKELRYLPRHQETQQQIENKLTTLRQLLATLKLPDTHTHDFARYVTNYSNEFAALVSLQQQIGLSETEGLQATLRSSAHQLEQQLQDNLEHRVQYLELRRLEKDFLLRLAPDYLRQQQTLASNLQAELTFADAQILQHYMQSMSALGTALEQRGFSQDQGLEGRMRQQIQATEALLKQMSEQLNLSVRDATQQINVLSLSIFVLIIVLVILLVSLIARSIHKPIQQASADLAKIRSEKDFTLRLSLQGKDEITLLGQDVNALLSDVQTLVKSVNHSLETLDAVTEELAKTSAGTAAVMRDQQSETYMVATAVTEMGATIQEIAANTEAAASTANSTNLNAQQGQQQVTDSVDFVKALAARLQDASESAAELEQDSITIGSVLDVIRAIADQTNLLALNAAIEAARAGEQGRGFAVVADEVRTLAQRTQQSTRQIETIIQTLQQRTKGIAITMQQCRDDGMQSAEQTNIAKDLLQQITTNVSNIMDMTTQIAAAIEEQSQVAAEVNRNVVKIRDMSEETAGTARQTNQLSETVAEQARELRLEVEKFRA